MDRVEKAIDTLRQQLGKGVLAVDEFRGQRTIDLDRDSIVQACQILRDDPELSFDMLADLTAVDFMPRKPRFMVVYQVYSVSHEVFLGLRVPLDEESTELSSVEGIYPSANWYEREVYDLFGIQFTGHSDMRRIMMPHNWEGHPLRKDYPLTVEEIQFSFNFDEIDRRKPYVKE